MKKPKVTRFNWLPTLMKDKFWILGGIFPRTQEKARRVKQMEKGMLKPENGVAQ